MSGGQTPDAPREDGGDGQSRDGTAGSAAAEAGLFTA
jgi:hypothetical protein